MSLVTGSKAWSQKQKVLVSEEVLALAKGKLDRADSLRILAEQIIVKQDVSIKNYESRIKNYEKEIAIINENCELTNSSSNGVIRILKEENSEIKRNRNFWRTLAIGIPTVLSGVATYLILK